MKQDKFSTATLLPKTITNVYSGQKIALIVFWVVTIGTIVRSLIHIFAADGGAQSIATIPLTSYSSTAAQTVIYMFGTWGLSQLLMAGVYLLVGIRYRSLIPLMYCFLICEYAGRLFIGWVKPLELSGVAPGGIGNYILVPLFVVMLILSLLQRKRK